MFTAVRFRVLKCVAILVVLLAGGRLAAQASELHQVLPVTLAEPVTLVVDLACGDLDIAYSRDGQVAISAVAEGSGDLKLDENYISKSLSVEQSGNKILIRQAAVTGIPAEKIKTRFRIDTPYRTEIMSVDNSGKQTVRGVLGPVDIRGGHGDVGVSYVPKAVTVHVENGNVDLEVIGEHVSVTTERGNITGERLAKGISAETGEGDIALMVIGASEATVKRGTGRVEIAGARESVVSSTDGGDMHVKAVPQGDWRLSSRSGTIRLELPPRAGFDLDASTQSGKLELNRDDRPTLASDASHIQEKINGGGQKIDARTEQGAIVIR